MKALKLIKSALPKHTAIIYMVISAVCIASAGFFAKIAMQYTNVQITLLARFGVPLLLLILFFSFYQRWKQLKFTYAKTHFIRAFFLTLAQFLLFISIIHLSLAEATVLYSTGPIFIAIFSFFKNKKINLQSLIAVLLGAVGVALMMHIENGIINPYVIVGLLSGFCLSASQLLLHSATKKEKNSHVMLFVYLFSTLLSLIYFGLINIEEELKTLTPMLSFSIPIIGILILVGLASLGNQFFRGKAYQQVKDPASIAPLIYISILVAGLYDIFFYNHLPNIEVIIGAILIVTSALFSKK
ncbi:carboxylate/amino acid/amine transporter [Piscirickettsia salmonis]|uniref:DMT family transporter n=1 Tax=Piscirickettsia salmonis TaxID=1238 RepID=UPI0012B9F76B|nr:DMT family transporter [Piscirickettsia salmonis]QGP51973.1 carboxylate/amino acid/amine transporter [Piscirickettsia salmonis]QGP56524.1 carboxylate/amino acid/amine transporter [Piscirickettsia salmonis]QGP61331.1 carboxylate/amino acid/amine transporter [Piscirickettsia salmonis]QGP66088.1 carboxylate/amino acid/amine transporter [Piscirickettsia salmonis]